MLRWYASNKLMFGVMPRKIPGVWGQSPQGAWGRIRKLSDFRIGSLAFPLDGRSPACGRGGVEESMQTRFSPNRRKGSIRATKSRNHSRPAVTPGQSSVRNGVNGNPLALNMLQTGLSAQAYRTETGLGTLGLETRILFPSIIFATAG